MSFLPPVRGGGVSALFSSPSGGAYVGRNGGRGGSPMGALLTAYLLWQQLRATGLLQDIEQNFAPNAGGRWRAGGRRLPYVTLLTVAVCFALYHFPQELSSLCGLPLSLDDLHATALQPYAVMQRREYYRLWLSALVHANDAHLYYNLLSLLYKGVALERSSTSSAHFAVQCFTLVTLAHGLVVTFAYGLDHYFQYSAEFYQHSVGISALLFAMKVLLNAKEIAEHGNDPHLMTNIQGWLVPLKYAHWIELIVIQLLTPNVSFMGHLCGIFAGYLYLQAIPVGQWLIGGAGGGPDQPNLLRRLGLFGVLYMIFKRIYRRCFGTQHEHDEHEQEQDRPHRPRFNHDPQGYRVGRPNEQQHQPQPQQPQPQQPPPPPDAEERKREVVDVDSDSEDLSAVMRNRNRPASVENPQHVNQNYHYEKEMKTLWDMGFHDRAHNYALLKKHRGHLERTLDELMRSN